MPRETLQIEIGNNQTAKIVVTPAAMPMSAPRSDQAGDTTSPSQRMVQAAFDRFNLPAAAPAAGLGSSGRVGGATPVRGPAELLSSGQASERGVHTGIAGAPYGQMQGTAAGAADRNRRPSSSSPGGGRLSAGRPGSRGGVSAFRPAIGTGLVR